MYMRSLRQWKVHWKQALLMSIALASALLLLIAQPSQQCPRTCNRLAILRPHSHGRSRHKVLVSYSFFEKDQGQLQNLEFFITAGMGIEQGQSSLPEGTDFSIVVNGDKCSPCIALSSHVEVQHTLQDGVSAMWSSQRIMVLHRSINVGMDLGAHNVTLEYLKEIEKLHTYKYFIFLNSSVRGPFYPSYMPVGWQWPDAFVSRLDKQIRLVASSIVCLPAEDAGGYGPRAESWAFAVDTESLSLLMSKGIFWTRDCKICRSEDGIVVGSEYGLSKVLLRAGHNFATLMSRYAPDTDWRDQAEWNCNDNVHPSRHGTYDGISMHPYETVFVKESWHVGEPFLSRYTRWHREHSAGRSGTDGSFNRDLYYYAMCNEGRRPQHVKDLFQPRNLTCTGSDQ